MSVTVKLKHLRIAPRKARLIADLIRGRNAQEAQKLLEFVTKKPAQPIKKLLNSGIAAAKNQKKSMESKNLYISKILVDEGPALKRWRAVSRGRAARIMKRTSHITLVLSEKKTKTKNTGANKNVS